MKKTFENAFLPCFPGFYETALLNSELEKESTENLLSAIHDGMGYPADLLREYYRKNKFDGIELDTEKYKTDCAKEFCFIVGADLSDILDSYVQIDFVKVSSPLWYNYSNDDVICNITLDNDKLENFLDWDHDEEYNHYIDCNNFKDRIDFRLEFLLMKYNTAIGCDYSLSSAICENLYSERVLETVRIIDYYKYSEDLENFLNTTAAEEIKKEYYRLLSQGEEYKKLMIWAGRDEKSIIEKVKSGMKQVVSELADLMIEGMEKA